MRSLSLPALLMLCVCFCSSTRCSAQATASKAFSPGVGSTFTIQALSEDKAFYTNVVIASGTAHAGKTNVAVFRPTSNRESEEYINYEENGDISMYIDMHVPGYRRGWCRVPIQSDSAFFFVTYDTTYADAGGSVVHEFYIDSLTRVGTTVLKLAGEEFTTQVITLSETDANGSQKLHKMYYASKLGVFVKFEPDGAELVSYTLK